MMGQELCKRQGVLWVKSSLDQPQGWDIVRKAFECKVFFTRLCIHCIT